MRKTFSRHLETIREGTNVQLDYSRILDQALCFKNEHFLPKKPKKPILHKILNTFFNVFLGMNYENTLLIGDMPYKSLFSPPFNAIFLERFYGSQANGDYLLEIIFPYLEALHSFRNVGL
jgi:hypothetical protein